MLIYIHNYIYPTCLLYFKKKMILYLLLRIIVLSFLILLDRLYFWFALSMYLMHLWMNGKHSCDKNLRQGVSPTRSWTCVNLIGVLIKRSASFSLIEEIVPPCGIRYYTQLLVEDGFIIACNWRYLFDIWPLTIGSGTHKIS